MMRGFWAQRRADEFDALVEGRPRAEKVTRDADLLELVGALRGVPEATPRPEFVADLRTRLMAEAETALVPDDLSRLRLAPRRTRRERRLAALVGGIAIVGASTSVAVASQSSLPGESLYPIKRVFESAHTSLSVGDADKGRTELSRASTRLDEVAALTQRTPADDEAIASTLSAFTDQATRGADLLVEDYAQQGTQSSITRLRGFAATSLDRLETIEPAVPSDARDELRTAASVLAQIDAEAAQRCPSCDSSPLSTLPPALAGEQIELPTTPRASDGASPRPSRPPTGKGTAHASDTTPDLPQVGGDGVPPGSVQNPSTNPSTVSAPDPLRSLTQQLTQGLTGGAGSPKSGGGATGSSGVPTPTVPSVGAVTQGLTDILQGVLTPATDGLGLPSPTK